MNVPAIKVWKMDYSFIIKNYLNPSLWEKVWTLFEFKDYVVTIQILSINCVDCQICFLIKLKNRTDISSFCSKSDTIYYSLKNSTVDFLIKRINGTIYRLITAYEKYEVFERLDIYADAVRQGEYEKERLTKIASEFLDDEGVTNEEIRNVYIENYVCENEKNDEYIRNLREVYQHHLITDLYLTFLESINDTDKYQEVLDDLGEDEIENVMAEIKKYKKHIETDEYAEEMRNLLDEI